MLDHLVIALVHLWLGSLVAGPIAAFLWSLSFKPIPKQARWYILGASAAAILLVLSPVSVSLPGRALDYGLLALLYPALCIAAASLGSRILSSIVLSLMLLSSTVSSELAIAERPSSNSGNIPVACGMRIRVEPRGGISDYYALVSVVWQPWWVPFEFRLDRRLFDYSRLHNDREPHRMSMEFFGAAPRDGCGVDVKYGSSVVWRAL